MFAQVYIFFVTCLAFSAAASLKDPATDEVDKAFEAFNTKVIGLKIDAPDHEFAFAKAVGSVFTRFSTLFMSGKMTLHGGNRTSETVKKDGDKISFEGQLFVNVEYLYRLTAGGLSQLSSGSAVVSLTESVNGILVVNDCTATISESTTIAPKSFTVEVTPKTGGFRGSATVRPPVNNKLYDTIEPVLKKAIVDNFKDLKVC